MPEVGESELRKAVEANFNATARHAETVRVVERFEGAVVWDGIVHVFELDGCPGSTRAYAWSHETTGSARRFVTVLHQGRVNSALNAVRAALVNEHRKRG